MDENTRTGALVCGFASSAIPTPAARPGLPMAPLWIFAAIGPAIVFAFKNGVVFALCFLGTWWIPCLTTSMVKWSIVKGDKQQKIGIPIVGATLLALAYWFSTKVDILLLGYPISGLTLGTIAALIGATVPVRDAVPSVDQAPERRDGEPEPLRWH